MLRPSVIGKRPINAAHQVEYCHTTEPVQDRTSCLCVNVSFQDLAKGGLFLISKTESGRRNQPWTKFTCKIYIVKTLLSFFLFQETVMNFNAVCANAKLCFFSLWCLFSSSHYRSTVLSLVL